MGEVNRLMDCLPQLQCRQCGYDGCRPYATAMAAGQEGVDRCLPGGYDTALKLAQVLGVDADNFATDIKQRAHGVVSAVIDPKACIGCRKCIDVCPQDAIIGASGLNHAVLNPACHGCGLCVPACPMDCISLQADNNPVDRLQMAPVHLARHEMHIDRQKKIAAEDRRAHIQAKRQASNKTLTKNNRLKYMLEARGRMRSKKECEEV